ncbi:MAG: hypothetical protein BGO86_07620 [Chryseobacterium sp. 36-9]|uniref:DUF2283 domain-containing protein n=1 Tax=Epilithonimonas pallida TaxID=373671 RepID=A0ABY1R6U3_9FLAO|nr:DUF2283 domain-containing protein [Epilithonimonas pallida]OJX28469.1 MAG: hypothetical protein BGO86_07620 [Chryseobacterium sp. 36-9]SMP97246.1 Protein of unknown function [Epilithonimonas pallida]
MEYEYDNESDGLYIWFVDDIDKESEKYDKEIWPEELKNEIGLLFDTNGKLLGMEIMPASKYFDEKRLENL